MKIDGGCHCRYIRYEADIREDRVLMCHCTDCQTFSSSAFRVNVQTVPDSFRLLSGTLKVYVKQADSGNKREQAFCPECGTQIYSAPVGDGPRAVGLRVGTITQRDRLVPTDQIWCRSAQAWLPEFPGLRRHETQPALGMGGIVWER